MQSKPDLMTYSERQDALFSAVRALEMLLPSSELGPLGSPRRVLHDAVSALQRDAEAREDGEQVRLRCPEAPRIHTGTSETLQLDDRSSSEPVPDTGATLMATLRNMLAQVDDGPRHCIGVMGDGTWTWKGSFLAHIERIRDALPEDSEED